MDEVFKALADPSRRRLLDGLNSRNGQTLRELCAGLDMARQSVSKHLAILEAADLVTTVRRGREKLHYLNAAPINAIAERWISRYDRHRVHALSDLKRALEGSPMHRPEFVYTTYINTTPERLWQGLTEASFTRRYWGTALISDWQVGSPITWEHADVTITDPDQVVLEADPYHRLSYTWHTFTREFGEAVGLDGETLAELAGERRSKVTFEIEDLVQSVRLTVVHDGFEPGSTVLSMIGEGWPHVLSGLKTLLETGEVLPAGAAEPGSPKAASPRSQPSPDRHDTPGE
ncbi:ArsR/SmtB family transcription factor [Sphaerimonospora sp. CA-214678]|uniref:ArsR/SmtB family transcription factor n=1 Tax=Sphaerimonospora sp. CA-214678 TaxID=3240029 RepID=UPI003D94AC6A